MLNTFMPLAAGRGASANSESKPERPWVEKSHFFVSKNVERLTKAPHFVAFDMICGATIWFGMFIFLSLLTPVCVGAEPSSPTKKTAAPPMREAEAEALRLNQQVMQLAMQGKLAEAIPLARRALELTERVHGKVHPNVSADLITLADLYRCQGDFFNAEPLIARAIEVDKQLYGPRDAEIGVDMGSLAMLYASKGDAKAAVKTYGEALDILYAARPSARHMANMAEMHRGYAEALLELNRYEEAMKQYANAEQIYEMTNNPARAAKTLVEMAEIDRQHGNQRRANIWLDRARQLKGQ